MEGRQKIEINNDNEHQWWKRTNGGRASAFVAMLLRADIQVAWCQTRAHSGRLIVNRVRGFSLGTIKIKIKVSIGMLPMSKGLGSGLGSGLGFGFGSGLGSRLGSKLG